MADVVIVGAGPAGLAAAHEVVAHGGRVVVLEGLAQVGGLSRTIVDGDNRFDIGPHRFFTRNAEVQALYASIVGADLLQVARRTRILHRDRWFDYPLTPLNALFGLGVGSSAAMLASYGAARLRHHLVPPRIETFEDWIVDRFGRQLHRAFFEGYTEKVWGIPCTQIGAEWAAQRIRGLSLGAAVAQAVRGRTGMTIRTLADEFLYPRRGAGTPYERMAEGLRHAGSGLVTGARVCGVRREGRHVRAVVAETSDGHRFEVEGRQFLVSAPLTDLVGWLEDVAPPGVRAARRGLRFRHHIGVHLVVEGPTFPDQWLYVHAREVAVARIANYRRFSPAMAAGPNVSPLTVEYFAFDGEPLWQCSDAALVAQATTDLVRLGLVDRDQVRSGFVVRSRDAYPVIERGSDGLVGSLKSWLDGFENLLTIGRSGMFRYNNQDHAMATGLLAARRVLGLGRADPWHVNIDAEYHEGAPAADASPRLD